MTQPKMQGLKITVTGNVQGVNFRRATQRKAEELEIQGYVRNLDNGAVEIEAQGTDEAMDKFLDWVKKGPSAASVNDVKTESQETGDYSGFQILR